jgi:hypothetical protein
MSEKKDGGAAFPISSHNWAEKGMTLRDYFAAKAMQAMIAHRYKVHEFTEEGSAHTAYEVADAMLIARDT